MNKELEAIIIKIESDVLTYKEKEILKHSLKELEVLKRKVKRYFKSKSNFETHNNNNEVSADYYFEYQEQEQELKEMIDNE